jgi:hypothetical protein
MPRDLEDERVQLTQSPDKFSGSGSSTGSDSIADEGEGMFSTFPREFVIIPEDQQQHNRGPNMHPYTRPLTVSDVDSCVAVENSAFTTPEERATKEKVR